MACTKTPDLKNTVLILSIRNLNFLSHMFKNLNMSILLAVDLPKIAGRVANSVDPNGTPRSVAPP